jgi:hypothetical protein
MTPLILKRAPIGDNQEDYDVLEDLLLQVHFLVGLGTASVVRGGSPSINHFPVVNYHKRGDGQDSVINYARHDGLYAGVKSMLGTTTRSRDCNGSWAGREERIDADHFLEIRFGIRLGRHVAWLPKKCRHAGIFIGKATACQQRHAADNDHRPDGH